MEDPHKPPDDPVKNIVGPAFAALTGAILTGLALLTFLSQTPLDGRLLA
jgi:hypothetical protein